MRCRHGIISRNFYLDGVSLFVGSADSVLFAVQPVAAPGCPCGADCADGQRAQQGSDVLGSGIP